MAKPSKEKMNIKKAVTKFLCVLALLYAGSLFAIDGMLSITTTKSYNDIWHKSIPSGGMPKIPATGIAYKNQRLYFLPLIYNFSTGKNQKPSVVYSLTIKQGDKIFLQKKDITGLKKTVNDTAGIFLAETIQTHEFTENGTYTIEITLKDAVSNTTKTLAASIYILDYIYAARPFSAADSFYTWQADYYKTANPGREIDGLVLLAQPYFQQKTETFITQLVFFADAFKNQKHLLTELENVYTTFSPDERLVILNLLNAINSVSKKLEAKFTADEKKYYEELKGYGLPYIPDTVAANPIVLEMLWMKFFATGEYLFAKKIVETLELVKYAGALNRIKEPGYTEKDKQEAFYETVYQVSYNNLLERLPTQPLLGDYCRYMLAHEKLPQIVKTELELLLATQPGGK